MGTTVTIEGITLHLSPPDEISNITWIGGDMYLMQLLAAWMTVDPTHDIPMNPQILGKPGVGKTTLAYCAAKRLNLPIYLFQATVDTRPEDLLVSPVIAQNNTIEYHASSLVSAMIQGGICIIDEANRMSEKSWASLAPLLDQRRYIESIIAGIKISAHPNFRICVTMNEDSSVFEVPEYIHSRLQPQILIEFPERDEELQILQFHLPFARKDLLEYTVNFLQKAHLNEKEFSIRDGINICRYYLKLDQYSGTKKSSPKDTVFDLILWRQAIRQVLGEEAVNFTFKMGLFREKNGSSQDTNSLSNEEHADGDNFMEEPEDADDLDELEEDSDTEFSDENEEDGFPAEKFDIFDDEINENSKLFRFIDKKAKKTSQQPPDLDDLSDLDDLEAQFSNMADPNDLIREFFERKERESKKSSATTPSTKSNEEPEEKKRKRSSLTK